MTEEELSYEIKQDNRLRAIGIDPDGDPVDIILQLDRRMKEHLAQLEKDEPKKRWEKADTAGGEYLCRFA